MSKLVLRFFSGAAAIDYALIVAGIAVAIIAVVLQARG